MNLFMGIFRRLILNWGPAKAEQMFFYVQAGFVALVVLALYWLTRKKETSAFRVREADKKRPAQFGKTNDTLADAKIPRVEPLRLAGIRLDGEPHEILGIPKNADAAQVQRAYRDLMKRYHPDIVGRPGTREWSDAQKIAEALNQARNRMLATQSQSPNRSGR
jgi:hypothetical protein